MGAWVTSAALQALAVFQACVLLAQAPPWTSGRAFALWWWVIVKDGDGCPFHQFNVEILVQLGRVEMCTLRTWPARGWKVCGGIFFGSAPLCLLLLLLVLLALLLFLFLGFLGSTLRLVTNAFLLLSVSLFDPSVHLGFRPCPLLGQQSHFLVRVHFQSLFDLRLRWLRM